MNGIFNNPALILRPLPSTGALGIAPAPRGRPLDIFTDLIFGGLEKPKFSIPSVFKNSGNGNDIEGPSPLGTSHSGLGMVGGNGDNKGNKRIEDPNPFDLFDELEELISRSKDHGDVIRKIDLHMGMLSGHADRLSYLTIVAGAYNLNENPLTDRSLIEIAHHTAGLVDPETNYITNSGIEKEMS